MNTCVCCGAIIPEGTMVCWICDHRKRKKIMYKREKECSGNSIYKEEGIFDVLQLD